jgi:hypothetical protein
LVCAFNCTVELEDWWPEVNVEVRRWLVNHPWDPVHPFAMEQVEAAGGPAAASGWWEPRNGWDNGELFLPQAAHLWIIRHPETEELGEQQKRDSRADYMSRGWPRRE